ncbi:MAG: tRNA epoxyqueuosine(34) reductase QueG [Candidatus Cyclobacteriaceae bacterium M3_2C_046]
MLKNRIVENTKIFKQKATQLGFQYCGIAKATYLEDEAPRLENWLNQNQHGQMGYMANHFEKRLDPTKLVPGARSVISLLYNYYPQQDFEDKMHYKISKYAYGADYHFVIKKKLKELLQYVRQEIGDVSGRAFVDSAPVMERAWAKRSGVGWIGKNSLLLNKNQGSFLFLAELIIDLPLETDGPVKDYCGTCTKCLDACPTEAITAPYQVDGSKCISYLTIELKDQIPPEFKGKMENWIFGCDICQNVCPWNRFSRPHQEPAFQPHPDLAQMNKKQWEEITEPVFNQLFKKSAVKRTKYKGLVRNIAFAKLKKPAQV